MRGLHGMRGCGCDTNLVWGVMAYANPSLAENLPVPPPYPKGRTGAALVRPKVTPYARDYRGTKRGEVPSWWVKRQRFSFAVNSYHMFGSDQWQFRRICLGARAVYRDGEQVYVNYTFDGTHQENSGSSSIFPVVWARLKVDDLSVDEFHLGFEAGQDPAWSASYTNPNAMDYPGSINRGGTLRGVYKTPRPRGWAAGERFLIFSGFSTADHAYFGQHVWSCARFDSSTYDPSDPLASWYDPDPVEPSTIYDIRYAIQRPSWRTYIDSKAESPDEAWVCAYDYTTRRFATGRWLDNNGISLANRIEHVIVDGNADPIAAEMGSDPNLVCYQHIYGRDLAVFRGSYDNETGDRSLDSWIYDGESLTKVRVAGMPVAFITADKDGNLIYGNQWGFKKEGVNGFTITGNGNSMVFPIGGTAPFWERVGEDPPPWWVEPETVDPLAREYSEAFQIVCNKDWIQVRGFNGHHSLATSSIESPDWPDYQVADDGNSRPEQLGGGSGSFATPIPNWSFSHDGQVRIPHVQSMTPYKGIVAEEDPGTTNNDPRRRIHSRNYLDEDTSDWETGGGGSPIVAWPKWDGPHQSTLFDSGIGEYLPNYPYHNWHHPNNGVLQETVADLFISATNNFDFDIGPDCDCGCGAKPSSY